MNNTISADVPDWSRETLSKFWEPGKRLLRTIRKYQAISDNKGYLSNLIKKYWVIEYRFWSVVTGAEIDLSCQIGGGLLIPHPNGIVIHPNAVIGPNCLIFQQVTIVHNVRIGGHVDIGAGAKILHSIHINDHARIGANAVVTTNIGEKETVVGIPARCI